MARIALASIDNIINNRIVNDRYPMKCIKIGCDPYKLEKQDFNDANIMRMSPTVNIMRMYPDIVNYFLCTKKDFIQRIKRMLTNHWKHMTSFLVAELKKLKKEF